MGGGLMQLVAYGAQDIYLTGNPQITFWKVVYRRHTNFSRETIEQTISGSAAASGRGTVTVSRNGDLLSSIYVHAATAGINVGDTLISDVEVQIGGQKIDKHTAEWMQMWAELSTPDSKAAAYKAMTGCVGVTGSGTDGVANLVQVPLQFWFCRNPGLALPLIALQYHEVKVVFNWGAETATRQVYCDYVYLDTDERRRFAQVSHEYLIEQLQYQAEGSAKSSYKLTLNHPVKSLYWTDAAGITTQKAKLKLNGHDRFAEQFKEYFQLRQPMDHHTAVPRQNVPAVGTPELLATPITLTGETEVNLVVAGSAPAVNVGEISVTAAGVVTFRTATDPGTLYVGDVLSLSYPSSAAEQTAHIVSITAVTTQWVDSTTICSITVNQTGADLAESALGDGGGYIMARTQNALCRTSTMTRTISMYSFALEPEEHQPSGTCNFSRIDTATLDFSASATVQNVYALNYNVLRIMSGMGGLAYSN
jgi:hypothetical protein